MVPQITAAEILVDFNEMLKFVWADTKVQPDNLYISADYYERMIREKKRPVFLESHLRRGQSGDRSFQHDSATGPVA